MKGKQKISQDTCLQESRAEPEGYAGGQTFIWMTENNLTNANKPEYGLLEQILSPTNLNRAYKRVRSNRGSNGVDKMEVESLKDYLVNNKEKLIQSILDGKYRPNPVRRVEILKEKGTRKLGIPTVGDRVAQMAVKIMLEPSIEPYFHPDSYGYRPGKSALDAVGKARERCWRYNWVLDVDIKGFFDNLRHDLLMRALQRHTDNKWVLLYIDRWLTAPMQNSDGDIVSRDKGTPQGGVCTPLTQ